LIKSRKYTYLPTKIQLTFSFGIQEELAQMVERALSMREVRGSIPLFIFFLSFAFDCIENPNKIIPASHSLTLYNLSGAYA